MRLARLSLGLGLLLLSSPAQAEVPNIQFSPLKAESTQVGEAIGWKVTVRILTDGLVGRVCLARFRLEQGERRWEETRKRPIQVPEWEETGFYKWSFLSDQFKLDKPLHVTFSLVDLVNQTELGNVTSSFRPDSAAALVVPSAKVIHFGRVVYEGRVDLSPTWERIQRGETLRQERTDGAIFSNRWDKIPHREKGYWREYVHPTTGVKGAGPQRLIVGKGGEIFYTPDYYRSFVQLR